MNWFVILSQKEMFIFVRHHIFNLCFSIVYYSTVVIRNQYFLFLLTIFTIAQFYAFLFHRLFLLIHKKCITCRECEWTSTSFEAEFLHSNILSCKESTLHWRRNDHNGVSNHQPHVYSDADQRKHQSSASPAFVWGIHRDRWIPRTKGQLRGKCFHLMTSSWRIQGLEQCLEYRV